MHDAETILDALIEEKNSQEYTMGILLQGRPGLAIGAIRKEQILDAWIDVISEKEFVDDDLFKRMMKVFRLEKIYVSLEDDEDD